MILTNEYRSFKKKKKVNKKKKQLKMKREIKFRAWLKRSKEMYQVEILDFEKQKAFIFTDNFDLWVDFDDIELMPFTGFYDKNGKEIYEGDILKSNYKDYMYWVVFENGGFYLYLPKEASIYFISNRYNRYNSMERAFEIFKEINIEIEVIGNIHEDKSLLEQ